MSIFINFCFGLIRVEKLFEILMCERQLKHLFEETYALFAKTIHYHWNVTSVSFMELHLLFERQYNELLEATDLIAEHIRTLKVKVPGHFTHPEKFSFQDDLTDREMIADLLKDHETIMTFLDQEAPLVSDIAANDLMIERRREHGKTAWMLRSYLVT